MPYRMQAANTDNDNNTMVVSINVHQDSQI